MVAPRQLRMDLRLPAEVWDRRGRSCDVRSDSQTVGAVVRRGDQELTSRRNSSLFRHGVGRESNDRLTSSALGDEFALFETSPYEEEKHVEHTPEVPIGRPRLPRSIGVSGLLLATHRTSR